MRSFVLIALIESVVVVLTVSGSTSAADNPVTPSSPGASISRADDIQQLASQIDELIIQNIESAGAQAAPRADDAEFLRRVNLDIAGKIPSVAVVRSFLADSSPNTTAIHGRPVATKFRLREEFYPQMASSHAARGKYRFPISISIARI